MLNYERMMEEIRERMQKLNSADLCALFLISAKSRTGNGAVPADEKALIRIASGIFKRFFRKTDIVGKVDVGRYAVFLNARCNENVIWEKASTLSSAFLMAVPDADCYMGVYLFPACMDIFENVFRKAEYALEMAYSDEKKRYYVYTALGENDAPLPAAAFPQGVSISSEEMAEGIRIFRVGEELTSVYTNPGFYRRLALNPEKADSAAICIHPADRKQYGEAIREAAQNGVAGGGRFRFSADGKGWVVCHVHLQPLPCSEGTPYVLEITRNITELEWFRSQFTERGEWLKMMLKKTDDQLWEVDLNTHIFRLLYAEDLLEGRQAVYENFPESLIESGRIHQESAEQFRSFARRLYRGRAKDSGNFIAQYRKTSCYGWVSLSYRMLYDEDGNPTKAIGIKEDLSSLAGQRAGSFFRREIPAVLYPHLYGYLQINLTNDAVERLQLEGQNQTGKARYQNYSELTAKNAGQFRMVKEDGVRLTARFRRERLLAEYETGRRWLLERIRVVDAEGNIRWLACGANLNRDAESGAVCLYVYLSEMSARYEWETEARVLNEWDENTGAYSEKAMWAMAERISDRSLPSVCAVAVIRMFGAEELLSGREQAHKRRDLLTALGFFLDTDCIYTQVEDDALAVFFPEVTSRARLIRRLETAISSARLSMEELDETRFLRFVAGVSCAEAKDADYEEMLCAAVRLCRLHSGEAEDKVLFSDGEEDDRDDIRLPADSKKDMDARPLELADEMQKEEMEFALGCLGLMLKAAGSAEATDGVLRMLGQYYEADRVYTLSLSEKGTIVTMMNEWTKEGKTSIQQYISGKRIESLPLLSRYASAEEPVIMSRRENRALTGSGKITWQYVIVPMKPEKDCRMLLCMENPRKEIERTALLSYILPYLSAERKKDSGSGTDGLSMDRYLSIPGMHSYINMVYSLDSDLYSSLGAMAIDIPDLARIKGEEGYQYGSRLVLYMAEVLLDIFDKALLFHTHEEEFIVLCTNTTYEAFQGRCRRVQQLIGRRYAGRFRVGVTWSDGVFNGRDLVQKALAIMKCSSLLEQPTHRTGHEWKTLGRPGGTEVYEKGRFTIYLQPKIDMRTGELLGAEALARVMDTEGNLLSHIRVIEAMERSGTIQDLDYFVLDRALHALSRWKRNGWRPVPVSTNFSRNTLLNQAALASILAILSCYPEVSQELLELEITETAGDVENNTFAEMIGRFDEYGLQFSLDDFGSGYSNMSMLANLKFSSIKLDRSMIRRITENAVSQMLVRDIAKICRECGMLCVAEGVETEEQVKVLLENGCICAQGFYYDKPLPVEEFEKKYFLNR